MPKKIFPTKLPAAQEARKWLGRGGEQKEFPGCLLGQGTGCRAGLRD